MAVETELKFRVPPRSIGTLASWRIPGTTTGERSADNLVSTYFDTSKHKLKCKGLSLRVRRIGNKYVQTIKAGTVPHLGRGEWETEVRDNAPEPAKIDGTPLKRLSAKRLCRKLKPVFETSVRRVVVPVHTKGSEIELAIDRGQIIAGRRKSRIEEIELELKSGPPADLFSIAKAVERKLKAELYLRSKSERGYDLLQGKEETAAFAENIKLDRETRAHDTFGFIAHSCVRQFAGNAHAVRCHDPEGVHQMRVGLRRLRAAISVFSKLLPRARTEKIKTGLKWLTSELAPARELDVFVKKEIHPAIKDLAHQGGKLIGDEFAEKRDEAFERAKKAVASERFRLLLIDVLEWIEIAKRNNAHNDASRSTGKFASRVLHRRIKKIDKQARHLARLSVRQRHKLRIKVKKMRYAIEFFESLFNKKQQKALARLSRHLKKIQSALGSLNDFAAHRKMAANAALKSGQSNGRVRAFALGVVVGRENEAAKALMETATREVGKLQSVSAF